MSRSERLKSLILVESLNENNSKGNKPLRKQPKADAIIASHRKNAFTTYCNTIR